MAVKKGRGGVGGGVGDGAGAGVVARLHIKTNPPVVFGSHIGCVVTGEAGTVVIVHGTGDSWWLFCSACGEGSGSEGFSAVPSKEVLMMIEESQRRAWR